MKANDTTIKSLIEGVKQFIIPVYQRTFAWNPDERKTKAMTVVKMWNDISELLDVEDSETHFFGSIVTMPISSGASEVSKYIVIDGQQRLISSSLLLAAIRDVAKGLKFEDTSPYVHFVEKLEENFLFNRLRGEEEKYKIVPTKRDRTFYFKILNKGDIEYSSDKLVRAFRFFLTQIRQNTKDTNDSDGVAKYLESLQNTLLKRLRIVDVKLENEDDPHDVFESLNYTGIPLSNWDLVRNYILMHYKDPGIQEEKYASVIIQIEENVGDQSEEFLRHFIGMNGKVTTSRNIYNSFKSLVPDSKNDEGDDIWNSKIEELSVVSEIYNKLIHPKEIEDTKLKNLVNFTTSKLKITTHFPLLMKLFKLFQEGAIDKEQLETSTKLIASYLLRRSVVYGTQGLNKFFPSIVVSLNSDPITVLHESFIAGYYAAPNDKMFEEYLLHNDQGSTNREVIKYLLFKLEQLNNKEAPPFSDIQLEHIMPQTLNEEWKIDLGSDWQNIYNSYLNKLGNLTITGYNQELKNFSFQRKKSGEKGYENSSIKITRELANYEKWGSDEIEERGKILAEKLSDMWKI
jgi:uncharacterized protein with ParB-like and HNH nuclease domain